jgi:hypothetical protein
LARLQDLLRHDCDSSRSRWLRCRGFRALPPFFDVGEAAVNYLNAVGIRVKMRTMERAAILSTWREKKLRGLFMTAVGASGNAATRVEAFIYSKGPYAYGGYADIGERFQQQAAGRDRGKREALLHRAYLPPYLLPPSWGRIHPHPRPPPSRGRGIRRCVGV